MDKYTITIARGYGSGGRVIGKLLAKELGIPFYDRNLLRLASDDSGINEQLFVDAVKRNLLPFIFALVCSSIFFSQWLLMQVTSNLFILIYNISNDSIHSINIIILFKPLGNKFSIVYRYFLNSTLIL